MNQNSNLKYSFQRNSQTSSQYQSPKRISNIKDILKSSQDSSQITSQLNQGQIRYNPITNQSSSLRVIKISQQKPFVQQSQVQNQPSYVKTYTNHQNYQPSVTNNYGSLYEQNYQQRQSWQKQSVYSNSQQHQINDDKVLLQQKLQEIQAENHQMKKELNRFKKQRSPSCQSNQAIKIERIIKKTEVIEKGQEEIDLLKKQNQELLNEIENLQRQNQKYSQKATKYKEQKILVKELQDKNQLQNLSLKNLEIKLEQLQKNNKELKSQLLLKGQGSQSSNLLIQKDFIAKENELYKTQELLKEKEDELKHLKEYYLQQQSQKQLQQIKDRKKQENILQELQKKLQEQKEFHKKEIESLNNMNQHLLQQIQLQDQGKDPEQKQQSFGELIKEQNTKVQQEYEQQIKNLTEQIYMQKEELQNMKNKKNIDKQQYYKYVFRLIAGLSTLESSKKQDQNEEYYLPEKQFSFL